MTYETLAPRFGKDITALFLAFHLSSGICTALVRSWQCFLYLYKYFEGWVLFFQLFLLIDRIFLE